MRFPGFIGPSYTLQSVDVDCQRCMNLYPEMDELGTGTEGEVASLVSTPGLRLLATLPTGPFRGNYTDSSGQLWAVGGNVLYQVSSYWTYSQVGTLNTNSGPVSFSDNGIEGVLVDGPYGYSWTLGLSSVFLPAGYASTATAAGITTLTVGSDYQEYFNGSSSQIVTLPVAATMAEGSGFNIVNLSSGPVIVQTSGGNSPASYVVTTNSSGTTTLTVTSAPQQYFTGALAQTLVLPVAATLATNQAFTIINLSTSAITVNTSGGITLQLLQPNSQLVATCTTPAGGTGLASWTGVSSINPDTVQLMTQNTQLTLTCENPAGGTGLASWSWVYTTGIQTNTFGQITDPNFLGATQVSFMDGYLIFNKPNSQQYFLSPLNSVTPFSGLDVASAEADPDNLLGHVATQENLYLFSSKHMEIWYDSGNEDFPFTRVQGAVSGIGCAAAFSIGKIENTIFWLGQDKNGRGSVYSAQGLVPSRISTFAIEEVIQGLGDLSSARAWTYQQAGHQFYCLNLPGATSTWVFDAITGLWHERSYFSAGQYSRHLADCHAYAYNTNVVGDYSNGNLYALDPTVFTDNGSPVIRERTSPHISKDTERLFHSRFIIDMERGVGLSGTGQGTNPQAMLQWSNDAGHSWSNEHWRSVGAIGSRVPRVIWNRLGHARNRVYRVKISDPVKVTLLGAEIDIDEGAA